MTAQLTHTTSDFTRLPGTAWEDPGTRRAWWRQVGRSVLFLAGHAVGWVLYVGSEAVREHLILLCVVFALFSVFRVPVELFGELGNAWSVRRVLKSHSWYVTENPPHGLGEHPKAKDANDPWFEVPDPDRPGQRLPLIIASAPLWWARRMKPEAPAERKAQIARFWYCGLPGDELVIAASRAGESTPHRLRHRHRRDTLVPENPARPPAELPHASLNALSHPPTRRTMRRRLVVHLVALLIWPAVFAAQVAAGVMHTANQGGVIGMGLLLELMGIPFHIWLIVVVRRMTHVLATHPWRPVDCQVRSRGKQQLVHIGATTFTTARISPVDPNATQLWIAGHPHQVCVVSDPGGAKPIRVAAMSTTDNPTP